MKAWSITLKDLQIFFKDRGALIYLFLMPIGFIMLFGGLAAADTGEQTQLLPLTAVNSDAGGQAAQDFIGLLADTELVEVRLLGQAEAEEGLDQAEISWVLFIPASFSGDLAADRQVQVRLVVHPNHDQIGLETVTRAIETASMNMSMLDYLDDSLRQLRAMQAAVPYIFNSFNTDLIEQQVELQQAQAADRPLILVEETTPKQALEADVEEGAEAELPSVGQVAVVGFAVLFVFLAAQTTAKGIYEEKRLGSFRRLLAAPIGKGELLGGKLLPNFLLTLVQILVMFLAGVFLIPLLGIPALELGGNLLGLVVISLVVALCSTSLGIFIAAIAHTEGQVGGISSGILWVAGLLGGSIVPLFLFPPFMDKIARFVPHYWANQAYFGLIFRGQSLAELWPTLLALLGFTGLFFAIGLWRFDFD